MSKKTSHQTTRQTPRRRSQRGSRPASFIQSSYGRRLRVETLEDRRMLAGVTVGNVFDVVNAPDTTSIAALIANDGGDGISLREAITAANNTGGTDTITFDSNVFTGGAASLIRLQLGQLPLITEAVHIDGGSQQVVISGDANGNDVLVSGTFITDIAASDTAGVLGDNNGRILDVTAPAGDEVRLTGLTITGGNMSGFGGGIISGDSMLVIENSSISGNRATSNGGGISTGSGDVTLTSSTVSGNSTTGNFADGGGIRTIDGVVTLTNSTVSGNSSADDGGGIHTSSGDVTLTNSTVSGNSSADDGGGIRTFTGDVTLTSSTVSDNISGTDGGGIYTRSGAVTLTSSTVSGNSSDFGGGGIYTRSGAVTFTSSTISGNNSGTGGGIWAYSGVVTLTNSTVTLNVSSGGTGGGMVAYGPTTITNSIVAGNTGGAVTNLAGTGSNFTGNFNLLGPGDSTGGANDIFISNNNLLLGPLADNGGPTQTHALLVGSPALDAGNSGATTDQRGLTRPVDHPTITNAIGGNGSDIGATERQEFPSLVVTTATDVVDAADLLTSLREAIAFADFLVGADTITFDASIFTGGASSLIRLGGTELAITDSLTIDGSTGIDIVITADANNDDTTLLGTDITDVANNTNTSDNSRIFFIGTGDTTLRGLTLTGGITDTAFEGGGGGIRSNSAGTLTLDQSTVSGNSSTFDGGGIYTQYGNVTLTSSTVSGNIAKGTYADGGGIFAFSGNVTLTSSTVSGNSSDNDGGGIYARSGDATLTSSTVSGNSSSYDGGGIYLYSGDVTLTGSTVSGNNSSYFGGGIFTRSGDVTLTSSTVSKNSSVNAGGGILTFSGEVTLTSSTVSENSSSGFGGGIFVNDSGTNPALTIENSIVAGNTDNGTAPDLRPDPDSALTVNFSLIGDNTGSGVTVATGTGNILNQSPLLGPLADNGGPTQTHALLVGSPAIDAGDPNAIAGQNGVPSFDQREAGFNRVEFGRIDMGAFEVQNEAPTFTSPATANVTENTQTVHTLTANDAEGQTVSFSILDVAPAGDLGPGQSLLAEQSIQSADGSHTLLFQADGNFVVYDSGVPVWASDTGGTGADIASMQTDGNLVIYVAGTPVFSTNTDGNPLSRLHLANDGTPMILRIDGATLWQGTLGNLSGGGTTFSPPALDASFATGADNGLFEVTGGDQLQFITPPDFETPTDANGDNIYEVSVLADDGNGGVTPQTILVTVIDVFEPAILGDYNLNGTVDAADYTVWLGTLGSSVAAFAGADGDGDGVIDQDDYNVWKANFGNTTVSSSGTGTGEAASAADEVVSIEATEVVATPASIVVSIQAVNPISEPITIVVPAEVVAPPASLPASLNSEAVDLALAFVIQDRNDFVPRSKAILTNPSYESATDDGLLSFYGDAARPVSTAEPTSLAKPHDERARDSVQRRDAWEDALDEVFAEEEVLETI